MACRGSSTQISAEQNHFAANSREERECRELRRSAENVEALADKW